MDKVSKNISAKKLFSILGNTKNPICCNDTRLDCDSISSSLVMASIFKRIFNKKLTLTFPSTFTKNIQNIYKDIDDLKSIKINTDPSIIKFTGYDALLVLDCANIKHLSKIDGFTKPNNICTINIDHHNDSNLLLSDYNYVFKRPSTCSLIYDILKKNKIRPTKYEAELLLLGILEDTGIFQFDKIESIDLVDVAQLLKHTKNVLFYYTHKLTYNEPPEEMYVKKIVLDHYVFDSKHKVAYSYALHSDYEKYHISEGNDINFSPADYFRKTDGVNYVIFAKEKVKGSFSVSLRSRLPDFDVSKIAAKFDGGGHIMASGLRIDNVKNVSEVFDKIIKVGENYTKQYNLNHKTS